MWDVDRLGREMTADQLRRWQEYAGIEGLREDRADLRSAIIASAVCNAQGVKINGRRPTPSDFIPVIDRDIRPEKGKPMDREEFRRMTSWMKVIMKAVSRERRG